MANVHTFGTSCEPPSTQELIHALAQHDQLLEHTAEFPQAGIHERFNEEWTMTRAYMEAQVHRSAAAARLFIREHGQAKVEKDLESTFLMIMNDLAENLFAHRMRTSIQWYSKTLR
jgi:hypothetical protein